MAKEKANPDFTDSAVNLKNPGEVKTLLEKRKEIKGRLDAAEAVLRALNEKSPAYGAFQEATKELNGVVGELRSAIDKFGSYQDIEAYFYGVKQERVTVTYSVEKVKEIIPAFAKNIIVEVANPATIAGLLKGKVIAESQAKACEIRKSNFRYVIDTR